MAARQLVCRQPAVTSQCEWKFVAAFISGIFKRLFGHTMEYVPPLLSASVYRGGVVSVNFFSKATPMQQASIQMKKVIARTDFRGKIYQKGGEKGIGGGNKDEKGDLFFHCYLVF